MIGVRRFLKHHFGAKRELFDALKDGQSPKVLVITCSDSRVVPPLLMGADPGDIFVIRNCGKYYSSLFCSFWRSRQLEYAVDVLGVEGIILCGHSYCGAVKALDVPDWKANYQLLHPVDSCKPTLTRLREKYPQ